MRNIEELVETLARDAAVVNPAPHPYMLGMKWTAGAAIYLVLTLIVTGLRPDLMAKFHDPWFVAETAVLAVIFIATSLSAALLSFPDLHQKRWVALAPALLFALFLLIIFLSWSADQPPAPPPAHTYECTTCIVLVALLPAAWIFHGMRKYATTHYRLAGGIALLSALSIGALWLRLHELNNSVAHVIEWHYLPMIVFAIIGMWLGRVILKW